MMDQDVPGKHHMGPGVVIGAAAYIAPRQRVRMASPRIDRKQAEMVAARRRAIIREACHVWRSDRGQHHVPYILEDIGMAVVYGRFGCGKKCKGIPYAAVLAQARGHVGLLLAE